MDISSLELIVWTGGVLGSVATLGVGFSLFIGLDLYSERIRSYKNTLFLDSCLLDPLPDAIREKPLLHHALVDSYVFSYHYVTSFGRINTSNYEFDIKAIEDKSGYNQTEGAVSFPKIREGNLSLCDE